MSISSSRIVAPAPPAQPGTPGRRRRRRRAPPPRRGSPSGLQDSGRDHRRDGRDQALDAPEPARAGRGRRDGSGGMRHLVLRADAPRLHVTGGSGFVGGRLINGWCAMSGAVRALARSDRAAIPAPAARARPRRPRRPERARRRHERAPTSASPRPRSRTSGPGRSSCASTWRAPARPARLPQRRGRPRRARQHRGRADAANRLVHAARRTRWHCARRRALLALEGDGRAGRARGGRRGAGGGDRAPRFVWGRGDTTLLPLLVEGTQLGA